MRYGPGSASGRHWWEVGKAIVSCLGEHASIEAGVLARRLEEQG